MKTPYKITLPTIAINITENPHQGVEYIVRSLDRRVLAKLLSEGDTNDRDLIRNALMHMKKENLDQIEVELDHFGQPVILDRAYLIVLYEALTKQALCRRFGEIKSIAELKQLDPIYAEIMSNEVIGEFAKKIDEIRDQWDKLAIGYDDWADIVSVRNLISKLEDEELGLQLRAQKGSLSSTDQFKLEELQLQIASLHSQLSNIDEHGDHVGLEVESREVASVVRIEQLIEQYSQIKKNNFVEFASRKEIMDEIRSAMLSGKSTLITGATGTGKTVLAVQVAKQIQRKMAELNAENNIDAKLLSDELKENPDYVAVLSGNANMTVGEIIAKIGIKTIDDGKGGKVMETTTQLGKILKAYSEGRIPIFDEIDLVPNDILMRTKHLATLRSGEIYTPQENGGSEVWIRNNIQLATANLKGSHHPDREDLDPAIVRIYQGITAGYLSKDEAYDLAVISCMSPNGTMIGISPEEWSDDGFVTRIVEFLKQIEDNYMGLTPLGAGIDSSDQYLSKAVMDIGIFSGLFAGYQTNRRAGSKIRNFREYVTDNLIKFITNQGYPLTDRKMLIQMANAKGLIDGAHKEIILKKCPDLSATIFTSLLTNIQSDLPAYDTDAIAIITPYELAQLDPYGVRQIDQLEWSQYVQMSELSKVFSTIEGQFLTDMSHPIAIQVNTLLTQITTSKTLDSDILDDFILMMEESAQGDGKVGELYDKLTTTDLGKTSLGRVQSTIDQRQEVRRIEAEKKKEQREELLTKIDNMEVFPSAHKISDASQNEFIQIATVIKDESKDLSLEELTHYAEKIDGFAQEAENLRKFAGDLEKVKKLTQDIDIDLLPEDIKSYIEEINSIDVTDVASIPGSDIDGYYDAMKVISDSSHALLIKQAEERNIRDLQEKLFELMDKGTKELEKKSLKGEDRKILRAKLKECAKIKDDERDVTLLHESCESLQSILADIWLKDEIVFEATDPLYELRNNILGKESDSFITSEKTIYEIKQVILMMMDENIISMDISYYSKTITYKFADDECHSLTENNHLSKNHDLEGEFIDYKDWGFPDSWGAKPRYEYLQTETLDAVSDDFMIPQYQPRDISLLLNRISKYGMLNESDSLLVLMLIHRFYGNYRLGQGGQYMHFDPQQCGIYQGSDGDFASILYYDTNVSVENETTIHRDDKDNTTFSGGSNSNNGDEDDLPF